jgi:hypothetical protein
MGAGGFAGRAVGLLSHVGAGLHLGPRHSGSKTGERTGAANVRRGLAAPRSKPTPATVVPFLIVGRRKQRGRRLRRPQGWEELPKDGHDLQSNVHATTSERSESAKSAHRRAWPGDHILFRSLRSRCTAMLVGLRTLIQTGHRPEKSTGISIRVSPALDRSVQAFPISPSTCAVQASALISTISLILCLASNQN